MLNLSLSALTTGKSALLLAALLPAGVSELLPFLLIILVFYFILIRPNQARNKKWQQMLANLKSGDRITTTGGIRGTIVHIKDDAIHIRVAPDNVKLEIARSAIASVSTEDESAAK